MAAEKVATSGVGHPFKWFYNFITLDFKIGNSQDEWQYEEEPHSSRRKEILKKHPEIKKLMGYDPTIAYIVSAEVLAQVNYKTIHSISSTILFFFYNLHSRYD